MSENASIPQKESKVLLDTRHVKVLAAKKQDLQDSFILVYLDEDKYGHLHTAQLRRMVEHLENLAPDSCWTAATKKFSVSIIDKASVKNKDLLITVGYDNPTNVDTRLVEDTFKKAFPDAKSMEFIHQHVEVMIK